MCPSYGRGACHVCVVAIGPVIQAHGVAFAGLGTTHGHVRYIGRDCPSAPQVALAPTGPSGVIKNAEGCVSKRLRKWREAMENLLSEKKVARATTSANSIHIVRRPKEMAFFFLASTL
jgi:hypothetical protein